jgi:uroporphyrinogen-III synthase
VHVIVTRPQAQASGWVDALRSLGLDAQALPLIEIAAVDDPGPVHAAWQQLESLSLVIFVSANAVQQFFAARPAVAVWPHGLIAGSTGPGTSAALKSAGVAEVLAPAPDSPQFDSEALWALLANQDWTDKQVLVVRGQDGRDWLSEQLRRQGARVDFVAAYRRQRPRLNGPQRLLLAAAEAAPAQHLWVFSSSEAVAQLQDLAPDADWRDARAVASHPRIAQAARQAGFGRVDHVPPDPAALARYLQHH